MKGRMSKLIHANMVRMIKSKIFWAAEIFLVGYSIFVYTMAHDSLSHSDSAGTAWLVYFFNDMLFIGAVIAVFTVVFIGVEYSDGTIRNKLVVGHTRKDIYFSNFIVCYAAGILQFVTYCAVSAAMGFLFTGSETLIQMNQMPWRIVYSLFIILVYSAAFSMLAMLDTNKTRAMVIGLFAVLALYILMTQIYGDLQQPEQTDRVVSSETGELQIEENFPNRKYVGGTKRIVYEWIDTFLPIDQAMYVIDHRATFSVKMPICFLVESMLFISIGMYVFREKDIK